MAGLFQQGYVFGQNQMVILRHRKGKFLRVNPDKNNQLDENGNNDNDNLSPWYCELHGQQNGFKVIKLKNRATGTYLRMYNNKNNSSSMHLSGLRIDAAGTGGKWSRFKVHKTSANKAKLESCELSGKYIAVFPKGPAITGGGKWAEFTFLRQVGYDPYIECKITLKSYHNKFVCAQPKNTNYGVVVNRDKANEWETFTSIPRGNGEIALKSCHGKFVSAQGNGRVDGNRDKILEWETFKVQEVRGKYGFKSSHSKYLSAQKNGTLQWNRNTLSIWEEFKVDIISTKHDINQFGVDMKSFEEKLFIIDNVIGNNSKTIDILKAQSKNKVNTIKQWNNVYNRVLMKRNQWMMRQKELKIDIESRIELKNDNDDIETKKDDNNHNMETIGNDKEISCDLMESLNCKYNEKWRELEEFKENMNREKSLLNKLNHETFQKFNDLEKELTWIQEIIHKIGKFDKDIIFVINYLMEKFKNEFIPNWMNWSIDDVIIWLEHNIEFRFKNEKNKKLLVQGVKSSSFTGKDLKSMNDVILRSYGIKEKEDRDLILNLFKVLISEMNMDDNIGINKSKKNEDNYNNEDDESEEEQDRKCIICMDETANMMFMPCNHIALCEKCYASNTFDKCAFCGNKCENVIKCYHIGF